MSEIDLAAVSSDDLRAELCRRKQSAQAKGKPMRYATKAEWAQAQLDGFQQTKVELKKESATGGDRGRMRRHEQYLHLDQQIEKFTRLVGFYKKKGL